MDKKYSSSFQLLSFFEIYLTTQKHWKVIRNKELKWTVVENFVVLFDEVEENPICPRWSFIVIYEIKGFGWIFEGRREVRNNFVVFL